MTQEERLQENCENAITALLMHKALLAEGEELQELNERLNAGDEPDGSEAFNRKMRWLLRREMRKKRLRRAAKPAFSALQKVAVACFVVVCLTSTVFAASPSLRENALNLIVNVYEEGTSFAFTSSADDLTEDEYVSGLEVGWLPEGFELTATEDDGEGYIRYDYSFTGVNNSDNFILIEKVEGETTSYFIDTEDCETETITINSVDAMYAYKPSENRHSVTIMDTQQYTFVSIFAVGVTHDEIIQIAESLVY